MFPDHKVPLWSQKWQTLVQKHQINQKAAVSAPTRDSTVIILATNYSVFVKWAQPIFLGLKKVSSDHKVAPRQQKWPKIAINAKITKKSALFALMGDPTAVILTINNSVFIKSS